MKKAILLLMTVIFLLVSLPVVTFAEPEGVEQPVISQIEDLREEIDSMKKTETERIEILDYYKSVSDHAINSVLLIVTGAAVLLTILTVIGSIAVPLISANKIQKIEKDANIAKEAAEDAKENALKAIRDLENRMMEIAKSAEEAKAFSKVARSETIASEGLAWYLNNEYDRALKSYNEAIELNPQEPRFYFNRGNVFYGQGSFDRAIEEFNRSIQLNPNNNDKAYYNRGRAYCEIEQYEKAIADYTHSIDYNSKNKKAYFNRARTYEKLGKQDEAKRDLEKYQNLVDENEKNIDIQNNPLLCQW